jgi:hypothetical protein
MSNQDEFEKNINRRDALKLFGLAGLSIFVPGRIPDMLIRGDGFFQDNAVAAPTAGHLTVSSSSAQYPIGTTIIFNGTLTNAYGLPVANATIAVADPIRQQSLVAGKTDGTGRFLYQIPGFYNSKGGNFIFTFSYGTITATPSLQVTAISPVIARSAMVTGNGKNSYTIDTYVDGSYIGRQTINPYQGNITLWKSSDPLQHSLKLVATNLSNRNCYTFTPVMNAITQNIQLTCPTVNPTFASYQATFCSTLGGVGNNLSKTCTINGTSIRDVYDSLIDWSVGIPTASLSPFYDTLKGRSETKSGVNFVPPTLSAYAQCSTFIGIQASCSFSCEAGAGLGIGLCIGACVPTSKILDLGCGLRCGISFAKASCGVGTEVNTQATWKM